ncbi:MAG: addiction module protein [Xanthomonadaceae bacterium]|nr:addiction module protein [Xanthomonadaceae bacterium]MDP2185910.1 addiction module protein [Xanthomonadales bacterium]MDZ4116322.1 addiction module protein [Xanthomonadaceae bacterium]
MPANIGFANKVGYGYPMVSTVLISQVKTLSAADRLELIGAVWETLSPIDAPATDEEKTLLDARLADLETNPGDHAPWPEVQARLRRLLP